MKRKIKKIAKIVGALTLIGVTLLGAVGCGIKVDEHNKVLDEKAALGQQVAELEEKAANMEAQAVEFSDENAALTEVLESNKLILDEKDAEIINLTAEIAEQIAEEDAMTTEAAMEEDEYDGLTLGEDVPDKEFDVYDLSFLGKDELEFNDNDYDYRELISLSGLKLGTAFTDDVDFEDNSYLLFNEKGAVSYTFKFEDAVDFTDISEDEPLEINFLGNNIEIVDMDANEFTYKIAEGFEMMVNDVVQFEGHNITLVGVSEDGDAVLVSADGVVKAIDIDDSEEFNGFEIFAKKAFAGSEIQMAELEFGTDVLQTIEDGDDYIEDNEDFVWEFETDGDELESLSISYDVKANDMDEEILGVGESLNFVDYFEVSYGLEEDYDYVKYSVSFDEVTDDDVAVMKFETNDDNIRIGSEKVSEVYFDGTNSYYEDGNDWVISDDVIELENDDVTLEVGFANNNVSFGEFKLRTLDFKSLGAEEEAEENDVKFNGDNIGKVDESMLFPGGFIAETIEDNAEEDEFVFQVPNEEVKGVIRVIQK